MATCLLFVVWFGSGLVMMYVAYPDFTQAEARAISRPIDWSRVGITPQEALAAAGVEGFPRSLTLAQQDGSPVYRISQGRARVAVSAIDGAIQEPVDVGGALTRVREAWPESQPRLIRTVQKDQWTVTGTYAPHRPLYRIALGDAAGTHVWVGARTGEIVLVATRAERAWNWVGAVPHWLYFTALRDRGEVWTQVVLWTAGLGMVGAASGIWIGLLRVRLRRRYTRGRITPYHGWTRWHHLLGVVGGVLVLTWVVSGWLSMNPNGWGGGQADVGAIRERWAAAPPGGTFGTDLTALARQAPAGAVEAEFFWLTGAPTVLLRDAGDVLSLLDANNGARVQLTDEDLEERAAAVLPQSRIVSTKRLETEDAYWYSHGRRVAILPVVKVVFDDPFGVWLYLDPRTGQIAGVSDESRRGARWTFNALHSLDFRFLTRFRPLWDIVMWGLLGLGLAISVTGLVLGWTTLTRTARRNRAIREANAR